MKHYQTYIRLYTNIAGEEKKPYTKSAKWYKAHQPQIKYAEKGQRIHSLRQEGKSLQEIGDIFGVTRERIRQIYNLYKIRNPQLHLPIKKEYREKVCEVCGKKLMRSTAESTFYKKIICTLCYNYKRYKRKTNMVHFRNHERSLYCLICKKTFTKELPYHVSNRCKYCYGSEAQKKLKGDRRRAEWLSFFYRGEEYTKRGKLYESF